MPCVKYMIPTFRLKQFFNGLVQFKRINPYQGRVYLALLSYRGKTGCYPSHATLAAAAGVCERTVRKALAEARLRGWIEWTNERHGRRQTSNRYQFTITVQYLNQVLNGLRDLARKTAEICEFFRRHDMPGSPYFYIKRAAQRLWEQVEPPQNSGPTAWQRLFETDPAAAIAQMRAIYR